MARHFYLFIYFLKQQSHPTYWHFRTPKGISEIWQDLQLETLKSLSVKLDLTHEKKQPNSLQCGLAGFKLCIHY